VASPLRLEWPPFYDPSNRRLSGFYPRLVQTFGQWKKLVDGELRLLKKADKEDVRILIRAVVSTYITNRLSLPGDSAYSIEAIVPLFGVMEGYELVYLACNPKGREKDPNAIVGQLERLAEFERQYSIPDRAALTRAADGYRISVVSAADDRVSGEIARFFSSRFIKYAAGIGMEDIRHKIQNDIVISSRDSGGKLAAVFMAEYGMVIVEGKRLMVFQFNHVVADQNAPYRALIPSMAFAALEEMERRVPQKIALHASCMAIGMLRAGIMLADFYLQEQYYMFNFGGSYQNAIVWYLLVGSSGSPISVQAEKALL